MDIVIAKIKRPSRDSDQIGFREVGAATAERDALAHMGIRNCFMEGPGDALSPGRVVDRALRDIADDAEARGPVRREKANDADVEKQLHRHVLYQVDRRRHTW